MGEGGESKFAKNSYMVYEEPHTESGKRYDLECIDTIDFDIICIINFVPWYLKRLH